MWVPPAQKHQEEELVVVSLTGCQQINQYDEVNSGSRYVTTLNIGVPSPSVARDYELDANVGNVGKLCKPRMLGQPR